MVVHGIRRYACWPWYGCGCPVGKLVSESVVRRHLKAANEERARLGRGPFKPGPKVTDPSITEYSIDLIEALEDHDTDDEDFMTSDVINEVLFSPHDLPSNALSGSSVCRRDLEVTYDLDSLGTDPRDDFQNPEELVMAEDDLRDSTSLLCSDLNEFTGGFLEPLTVGHNPLPPCTSLNGAARPGNEPSSHSVWNGHHSADGHALISSSNVGENEELGQEDLPSVADEQASEYEYLPPVGDHEFSRIPELLSWILDNRKWVDLYVKHGLEFTVMDDILAAIRALCKRWITVMNFIARSACILENLVKIPNCPDHMCYAHLRGTDPIEFCVECGNEKPKLDDPYCDSVSYLPILPRIAAIIRDEKGYEALYRYRHQYASEEGVFSDYFDSAAFHSLCANYGGEGNLRHDIFVSVSTDGFQAHKNREYDVWPVDAVMFNLPPEQRTCTKNVIPLMFIPDGKEPKDLQSYIVPFVNELLDIAESGGALLPFFDVVERRVRIHLIHFTGDSPAIAKIACLKGHHGKCHFRYCQAQGVYYPSARGYYFPSQFKSESGEMTVIYRTDALPSRTEASTSETLLQLENASTSEELNRISKDTGIKGPSVLLALPSVVPYTSFPIDIMHIFYNIQVRLLELITGSEDETYNLGSTVIDKLDDEMRTWSVHLSGQTCTRPKPLSQFRRWKAAEHRQFSLMYCLVLFDGYLPKEYLNGLRYFVELVDVCTQTFVTDRQIEQCSAVALSFFRHYEEMYMRYDWNRIKFSKYVFHQVLHLKECLVEFGPLPYCAQNWMEGYIGWTSDRNNARHLAAESMARNAFFLESCKIFFEEPFQYSAEHYDRIREDVDIEFLSPLGVSFICEEEDQGRRTRNLLADYLKRKYQLSTAESRTMAQRVDKVESFSRTRFYCGNGTQTARIHRGCNFVEGSRRVTRESSYVAMEMDGTADSADVYYGRLKTLLTFEIHKLDDEDPLPCHTKHQVAIMDWASGICVGDQGQIYKAGKASQCFTSSTMEDAVIISRLIGLVQHTMPRITGGVHNRGSRSSQAVGRMRTYFLDERVRSDYLLDPEMTSADGVNRVLRGLRSSR